MIREELMANYSNDSDDCFDKKLSSDTEYSFGRPVFILGTAKRSGTNFLKNMICLHPDCFSPGPVWEDFLLVESDYLNKYVGCTFNRWNSSWNVEGFLDGKSTLLSKIGDGVLDYLHQQFYSDTANTGKINEAINNNSQNLRLVTKTPTVQNIDNFFKLFPNACLIVITRDGRAVTESASKSFNKPFNIAIQEWNEEAQMLARFAKGKSFKEEQCHIVKYEDILSNSHHELTKVLGFLGLDVSRYNFDDVDNAPVIGSSELSKAGDIHWDATPKDSSFNPSKRWSKWSRWSHARFNWLAGRAQVDLGYSIEKQSKVFIILNIILDCFWFFAWKLWKLARKAKYKF